MSKFDITKKVFMENLLLTTALNHEVNKESLKMLIDDVTHHPEVDENDELTGNIAIEYRTEMIVSKEEYESLIKRAYDIMKDVDFFE